MKFREFFGRLQDPNSMVHGAVSTGLIAGLALIEPRRLSPGRRLAYRSSIAALTGWMVWGNLRPGQDADLELDPVSRVALTTGAAGAALGLADFGEAFDARVHDGLVRAGVRRPRIWMAAGEAAVSAVSWWLARQNNRLAADDHKFDFSDFDYDEVDGPQRELVELPNEFRDLVSLLLSATDDFGAPQLREQLAAARAISFDDGALEISFVQFDIPEDLPRAVPGNAWFPVIGRFRALEGRTFDLRIHVEDGRFESVHVEEGADWSIAERDAWYESDRDISEITAWPKLEDLEVLIETEAGCQPIRR